METNGKLNGVVVYEKIMAEKLYVKLAVVLARGQKNPVSIFYHIKWNFHEPVGGFLSSGTAMKVLL